MPDDDAKQQGNAFRWSAGGWFGGQIGATAWILLLGILLVPGAPGLGALVIAFSLVPNALGVILWRMRDRIRPYPAVQLRAAVSGVFALFTFIALDVAGRITSLQAGEGRGVYWVLLVYPGVMFMFHLQNRAARKRDS